MSRRKILFVQRPRGGGSATGLCDVIRALDRAKYEPVVLFYAMNRYVTEVWELGAQTLFLPDRIPSRPTSRVARSVRRVARGRPARQWSGFLTGQLPLARRLGGLIREERVDLVYQNNNPATNRASILAAHLAGVPQVAQVRFLARYYPPIDRRLAAYVARFLYVSEAVERQFHTALNLADRRGEVLYEPVNFRAFSPDVRAGLRIRRELGLGEDDSVVTVVGRLVPWKGQDVFLEAFRTIAPTFPRAKALVVGAPGGSETESVFARRLRTMVRESGLEMRVLFTGFRQDVPHVLAASDLVVHSSSSPEPFGRVVVEAMAAGRPVVATDAGGVPEIVDRGVTGLLVPPGDAPRMALAMHELLRDPDRRRRMGKAARQRSRSRFDPEEFAGRLNAILENTLSGAKRPAPNGVKGWLAMAGMAQQRR